ncbi:MAG: A24 family peptidase [Clostridiales bacterium]|nr:A24 family peptidase [Clostridiales bacterium]
MDIKTKRIPNRWIGLIFLIGWIDAFFTKEAGDYIKFSIITFLICSIGFWIGAVGGADVKLIGVMAGWIRSWDIWICVVAACMSAGFIGIIQMIYQRKFCSRMSETYRFFRALFFGQINGWKERLPDTEPICFSFYILIGYWIMRYVS